MQAPNNHISKISNLPVDYTFGKGEKHAELRGGFNRSFRVAATAESLANLSDGYWDYLIEEKS